eukprot:9500217-Pyramimonas_sp.AAC.1
MGLAGWNQIHNPCQFCECSGADMHNHDAFGESDVTNPWAARAHGDYEAACKRCEVHVDLNTPADLAELNSRLRWMRPGGGKKQKSNLAARGIGTEVTVAGTRLLPGDRLEPSAIVGDIGNITRLVTPCRVTFWRQRVSQNGYPMDPINHRNPLFNDTLGTSPARSLAVDIMHAAHLGVMQKWVSAAAWRILLLNVHDFPGTQPHILDLGIRNMNACLRRWQQDKHIPFGNRIWAVTLKMLGKIKGSSIQDS